MMLQHDDRGEVATTSERSVGRFPLATHNAERTWTRLREISNLLCMFGIDWIDSGCLIGSVSADSLSRNANPRHRKLNMVEIRPLMQISDRDVVRLA